MAANMECGLLVNNIEKANVPLLGALFYDTINSHYVS